MGWTEISRHATQEEATAVTRSILAMAVVLAMAAAMFASLRCHRGGETKSRGNTITAHGRAVARPAALSVCSTGRVRSCY